MAKKFVIQTNKAPQPLQGAPYSQAIVSNGFVFTAGQIGAKADGSGLVGEGVEEQTDQVFANLKAILEASGSSLDRIVKTTCFLSDLGNFSAFNEVYRRHFDSGFPARSTFGVTLPAGILVEVEAIATVG